MLVASVLTVINTAYQANWDDTIYNNLAAATMTQMGWTKQMNKKYSERITNRYFKMPHLSLNSSTSSLSLTGDVSRLSFKAPVGAIHLPVNPETGKLCVFLNSVLWGGTVFTGFVLLTGDGWWTRSLLLRPASDNACFLGALLTEICRASSGMFWDAGSCSSGLALKRWCHSRRWEPHCLALRLGATSALSLS